MKNFLGIFKKPAKKTLNNALRESLKNKYIIFQSLLTENNQVLGLMADMEEKLSGEFLFDRHYIDSRVRLIEGGVSKIINSINTLSGDKYTELYEIYDRIYKEIDTTLARKFEVPVSDLTLPLENLTKEMTNIAGGKIAHLAEVKNRINLLVPEGFSISAYAFKRFMEHNRISEKINEKLSALTVDNIEELNNVSKEIQNMVIGAEIPEDLLNAIQNSVESLKLKVKNPPYPNPLPQGERESFISPPLMGGEEDASEPSTLRVSVRSSAVLEDGEFSFAGQYATFLNVSESLIIQKYKEVVASLFTPRAIFYYKTKGFSEDEMVMAVGVLQMVDAKAGGVIYTRDPNATEKGVIIINAVRGLGKSVVDGSTTPDSYIVSRSAGAILGKKLSAQETMLVCNSEGNIKEVSVPHEIVGEAYLTDEHIKLLFKYAIVLENHYGRPQDIEWAIDRNNQIYILQSRPLRMFKVESSKFKVPRRIEKYNILLDRGVIACKGIGYGKAFILKDEEDLNNFPDGAVLVAKHTSTKFVTVMNKASAIVTDVGGVTGHTASLAREYNVPAILNAETATSVIRDGQEITVDAINCNIYEGRVEELLKFKVQSSKFKETRLFMMLGKILKYITPLSLTDPDAEAFKAENCKTFHDITRFVHEKAMDEMFNIGEGHDVKKTESVILKAAIPLGAHLLDLDGGIKSDIKKAAPADILSIPFSALLNGMTVMRWPEPRPADVKGFLGMMAHTASIPEEQLRQTGEKSFAIISLNYMNFSIRLGYHFSMIEAYAGDNINDNYIKFFFKGGGAVHDRRLRRVRLIKEILKKMDFRVNVTGDVMNAAITKYKKSTIEEKLTALGKLTAYTKQLDMVMYNDAITVHFIEEFVKDHIQHS